MTLRIGRLTDGRRERLAAYLLADDDFVVLGSSHEVERGIEPFLYFVAEANGEVVGHVEGRFDSGYSERFELDLPDGQGWIYTLHVLSSHRRHGVGAALIRTFAAEASLRGCSHVACLLDQSDEDGLRDHARFFALCGMRPILPGDPDDAVIGTVGDILEATNALPDLSKPERSVRSAHVGNKPKMTKR